MLMNRAPLDAGAIKEWAMPYLDQKRKPAGTRTLDGVKPHPRQPVKLPPPVKIPAPAVTKG